MVIEAAFLSSFADDLFSSVAAFGDAQTLEMLDVSADTRTTEGQRKARQIIGSAIANALDPRRCNDPSLRIALVKGSGGSGKSHVLATSLRRAAMTQEAYPAVLQLTAPIKSGEYEAWLTEAVIRQLSARHFADASNHSPLRRLAGRLLDQLDIVDRERFEETTHDIHDGTAIKAAQQAAQEINQRASDRGVDECPGIGFLAALILAGFGNDAARTYLRRGTIGNSLRSLDLDEVTAGYHRIDVLVNLGRAARVVGACIALAFDQVENMVRLADRDIFIHALTQAVRIAENVNSAAIIFATIADEYDKLAEALPDTDRDRIERDGPTPAVLGETTPDFLRAVLAQRLSVLRDRAGLPAAGDSLSPLPDWFTTPVLRLRSVRVALREVSQFRESALQLRRLPTREEWSRLPTLGEDERHDRPPTRDFDKEWADFQDRNAASVLVPDSDKGGLVAWWAEQASRENLAAAGVAASLTLRREQIETAVVEIGLAVDGVVVERRQAAICDAPNHGGRLRDHLHAFLEAADGVVPIALRTNGFPRGARTLVAPALKRLETLDGLKIDLDETEWQDLHRARQFAETSAADPDFLTWRRDRQWLTQLVTALQPLIAPPAPLVGGTGQTETTQSGGAPREPAGGQDEATAGATHGEQKTIAKTPSDQQDKLDGSANGEVGKPPLTPFPVHIGTSFEGLAIAWDPYRKSPNALNNYGFMVTGDAGSGKTQTIRVLIDAACRHGLPLTIFDFKADYCDPGFTAPLDIEVIDVYTDGLPFNPMQPPLRGASGTRPVEYAFELAGILARVFRLGAVQLGRLREAITQVYQSAGIRPQEWIDPARVTWPLFDRVVEQLREMNGTAALVAKLSILTELRLFGGGDPRSPFETFLGKRICLKLNELATDEIKSALAEILIVQLHAFALRGEQPRRLTRLMVFDEAHRVKDSRRLEMLAREGRAFGIGIVVGTQYPGDIPESTAGSLASNLFLMNNQADHRRYVVEQVFGTASSPEARRLLDQLGNLGPLEGLFSNNHHQRVFLRVLPHFAR